MKKAKTTSLYPDQIVPLSLAFVVFAVMCLLLLLEINILNKLIVSRERIIPVVRFGDVIIGLTIYLKTSIDFAIFIGRLMSQFPGWKNRVMIEIGTALGNTMGTLAILILWDLFREVPILMAAMIFLAALVLFRLAEDGLDHIKNEEGKYHISFGGFEIWFEKILQRFNRAVAPFLNILVPHVSMNAKIKPGLWSLFKFSFTIPFILGLDDFAGYIPLFSVVNVFGFAVGVFLGHMILNIFLFLSPKRTVQIVKNPIISFIGSIAFFGLGVWGLIEVVKILFLHH